MGINIFGGIGAAPAPMPPVTPEASTTGVPNDLFMVEKQLVLKIANSDLYRCTVRITEEKEYLTDEACNYYVVYVAAGSWRGFTDKTLPDCLKIALSLAASAKTDAYKIYDKVPPPHDTIGWPAGSTTFGRYFIVVLNSNEIEQLRQVALEKFPVCEVDIDKYHAEKENELKAAAIASMQAQQAQQAQAQATQSAYGQYYQQQQMAQQTAQQLGSIYAGNTSNAAWNHKNTSSQVSIAPRAYGPAPSTHSTASRELWDTFKSIFYSK